MAQRFSRRKPYTLTRLTNICRLIIIVTVRNTPTYILCWMPALIHFSYLNTIGKVRHNNEIRRNSTELAEAVPIDLYICLVSLTFTCIVCVRPSGRCIVTLYKHDFVKYFTVTIMCEFLEWLQRGRKSISIASVLFHINKTERCNILSLSKYTC